MLRSEAVALAQSVSLDEASLLLMGTGLLVSLLVLQMLWSYRKRSRSGSDAGSAPKTSGVEGDHESHDDHGGAGVDGEVMLCPECGKPTEAEYRYCRHCVEDTGRSYAGSGGDGESSRSGMF